MCAQVTWHVIYATFGRFKSYSEIKSCYGLHSVYCADMVRFCLSSRSAKSSKINYQAGVCCHSTEQSQSPAGRRGVIVLASLPYKTKRHEVKSRAQSEAEEDRLGQVLHVRERARPGTTSSASPGLVRRPEEGQWLHCAAEDSLWSHRRRATQPVHRPCKLRQAAYCKLEDTEESHTRSGAYWAITEGGDVGGTWLLLRSPQHRLKEKHLHPPGTRSPRPPDRYDTPPRPSARPVTL